MRNFLMIFNSLYFSDSLAKHRITHLLECHGIVYPLAFGYSIAVVCIFV